MSAKYINPALPSMIRGLYRADLREKSIQNMLDLAADLVQELIELREKRAEWEAEQGDYYEGFEEGVKVGRAGLGPRPITDEMVKAAFQSWNAWHTGTVWDRLCAALEAAEAARR